MLAPYRPSVTVQVCDATAADPDQKTEVCLPHVFMAPLRPDLICFSHTQIAKNRRQAHAVNRYAGHQHSAESWGTGRAVSRIPRVSGGGTSRAGQGAFGNMCRSGRMFAPTKTWRRWHRKLNTNQRRYAVVSSVAATGLPSLVMSRGHLIDNVPEIPLVVDNSVQKIQTTKEAIAVLKKIGAWEDCVRVRKSKTIRGGRGKSRNRRYVHRLGPLIIYKKDEGIRQSFRNLTGVECAQVENLNMLRLAPGGRMGRFVIWTEAAFRKLNDVFGSTTKFSKQKKGYKLPRMIMENSDIARIINSAEVQTKLRPKERMGNRPKRVGRRNPLRNLAQMIKLNPYAQTLKRQRIKAHRHQQAGKVDLDLEKRKRRKTEMRKFIEQQKKVNYQRLIDDNFVAPERVKIDAAKEKQQYAHWEQYSHFKYLSEEKIAEIMLERKYEKQYREKQGKFGAKKAKSKSGGAAGVDYAALVHKHRTWDNDPCMGKKVSLSLLNKHTLAYSEHEVGGVAVDHAGPKPGQPVLVMLWGKYDKNTYQFMPWYAGIDVAFPGIYVVGVSVAMDKKSQIAACLKNSLNKGHKDYANYSNFQTSLPLAWDKAGKLQAGLEEAMDGKMYNLPYAFLIDAGGKIVWYQNHAQCASTMDVTKVQAELIKVMKQQCASLVKTGKCIEYGAAEVESSSEDEGEAIGDGNAMADFLG